ncbi:MAG: GldG family protein [Myxococcota bacterium]|nr:GldG family protein [Myxococcota bacterium]
MNPSRKKLRRSALIAVPLWILVSLLANIAVKDTRIRWDFTSSQRHTMSSESIELLSSARSQISVKAFLPGSLPPPYSDVVRAIKTGLMTFRAESPVPFVVDVFDPLDPALTAKEKETLDKNADAYGLKKADLQIIRADQRVGLSVHFGLVINYESRQAIVPLIQRPSQFEYAFARTLQAVLNRDFEKPKIAFSQGHGEPNVVDSPLKAEFSSLGMLESIKLDGSPIPRDVDVLVILGPKRSFNKAERFAIDQFLMRGKSLVALLDYRQQSTVYPNILIKSLTGLESLFETYGVQIETELTFVDRINPSPAPIKRDQNGQVIYSNHPLYSRMMSPSPEHPAVANMTNLVMPMASPIKPTASAHQNLQIEPIFVGPKDVVLANQIARFEPETYVVSSNDEVPGYKMAAAITLNGILKSAHTRDDQPTKMNALPGSPNQEPTVFLPSSRGDSRILIASSGTRMLAASQTGLRFFKNAVAWASIDSSLVGIRARDRLPANLVKTTSTDRTAIRIVSIFGPVLLLVLVGWIATRRKAI